MLNSLTDKQKEFWKGCDHRWNIKCGATRSGKTFLDYYLIPKRIRAVSGKDGLYVILGNIDMFKKLATKLGLDGDISIHEVFTLTCLLNSVKSGNLGDLERLSKLLGEDKQNENADVLSKLDKVIGEVDKLAE